MKRIWLISLLAILLAVSLAGCAGEGEPTGGTESGTASGEVTEAGTAGESSDSILLGSKDGTAGALIVDSDAGAYLRDAAYSYRSAVKAGCSITPELLYPDSVYSGRQIMITTDPQRASQQGLGYTGYCISETADGNVELLAYEQIVAYLGFEKLKKSIVYGDGEYRLQKSVLGTYALSEYDAYIPQFSDNSKLKDVYCCGENDNYRVNFTDVTENAYLAYLQALTAAGFEKKTENDIAGNLSAGFVKNKVGVYVSYSPSNSLLGINYGKKTYYLPETEQFDEADRVCETTLAQIQIDGAGLNLIIQLGDGRFIIFDGGNTTPSSELGTQGNAAARTLAYLKEKTPEGEKPVIAAWIITHGHNDHITSATEFLRNYRNEVEIQSFMYNFSDELSPFAVLYSGESGAAVTRLVKAWRSTVRSAFPLAGVIVPHIGQKFTFADVTLEVLVTHEDVAAKYGPAALASANHACAAYRLTVGDVQCIILGDSETVGCSLMVDYYGSDELKSDIMQAAHHGLNGATLSLYQAIDPEIVIWPCADVYYFNDPRNTGADSGYSFNLWIRDDNIKKRLHYTSSYRTVIDLRDLTKITVTPHDPTYDIATE